MDKLFIFIRIISLSAGEASLFTPASHAARAPCLSPAQQNFAAQIGHNGGPALTFDAVEGFQRRISLFHLQLNAGQTHTDNRFQIIIRCGRQPLLQLLFSVRQIVLFNKMLCQLERGEGAVGIFLLSAEFLCP